MTEHMFWLIDQFNLASGMSALVFVATKHPGNGQTVQKLQFNPEWTDHIVANEHIF